MQRRHFLRLCQSAFGAGIVATLLRPIKAIATSQPDPRPEFASAEIEQVLAFFFDTVEAADDASIRITAPLMTTHKQLVPFKIEAPGAEKIAVLFDANTEPLIMAMNQNNNSQGVVIGRARLAGSGNLHCYALRNGIVGRATLRITVGGHWQE